MMSSKTEMILEKTIAGFFFFFILHSHWNVYVKLYLGSGGNLENCSHVQRIVRSSERSGVFTGTIGFPNYSGLPASKLE